MVLSHCFRSGVTTNTLDLSSALIQLGHQVDLLVGQNQDDADEAKLINDFKRCGVRVFTTKFGCSTFARLRQTLVFAMHMLTKRYDVIHIQSPYCSFIPWLLHKKFTSTLHVNDLTRCFYYKKATHLIAISKETKTYAQKLYGYADKDVTIINHGVSIKYAHDLSEGAKREAKLRLGIPEDKLIIGMVCSVSKRKGHDLLLNAARALPEALRRNIHFVFVGSPDSEAANSWIEEQIQESGWSSHVSRFPFQDPEIFYKLFDIFVLPSRLEGFPLVIPEAMLSGCCCIRSNTEGASEQIEHGVDGLIFENENIHQLADELQSLIEDETLRHRLAQAGREKALKKFTNMEMAKQTLVVYNKVIHEY